MKSFLRHVFLFVIYGATGSFLALLFVFVAVLQNRPDLHVWHTANLDEEFTVGKSESIKNFSDYQQLEQRLFQQLNERVYDQIEDADRRLLNRYHSGSLTDPQSYPRDWNRSFEFTTANPKGGVLLIHGLSDSPYSMRSLGKLFQSMGYWVVGLRLPGHGAAPSGLVNMTWRDFAAATEMAARHVVKQIGEDKPFFIAGFSTGAALSVDYSLGILAGDDNPMPDGLILLSPAIGVTPIAALAKWQSDLSRVPGLEKLAWESIQPEYDPFKYNSFAVNAGDQIYQLTAEISRQFNNLDQGKGVENFPRVLAFQSVVDATVSTPALVSGLFDRLAAQEHELVLFDINRNAQAEPILASHPEAATRQLLENRTLPFTLTVVTNLSPGTNDVILKQKAANSEEIRDITLGTKWPDNIFSLSHTALPFPPDDPVYGVNEKTDQSTIHLGRIDLLGEKGLLLIPADELNRLRYNPFYSYVEERVKSFVTNNSD
jgi:alpha-beta hydrolase superfamily lysophospholipase